MMSNDKKPLTKAEIDKKELPDSIPTSLTGVRSCPPPHEVKAPEWDFWEDIPEVKLWQACALALNIDPDSMERNQQVWKSPRFDKLLRKLEANISSKQHFTSTYPYDDVRLSEFAAWCGYIDFDIPPRLAALANDAPQAAPDTNGKAERLSVSSQQDNAILNWLSQNKHNPKSLPVAPKGKSGVKKSCRDALCNQSKQLFSSPSVFDTAWERLRANSEIIDVK